MRFWVSWYEPKDPETPGDMRPNGEWPLPEEILGWWCTGENETHHTLCVVLEAVSEEHALECIGRGWPGHGRWRFVESRPKGWMPPAERFPRQEKP